MTGEQVMWIACTGAVVVGVIAVLGMFLNRGQAERLKRLKVIEKALAHPALDPATQNELMRVLAAEGQEERRAAADTWERLRHVGRSVLVAVGWVCFVAGGATLALRAFRVVDFTPPSGTLWLTFVAGFVMMSLPVATRELARRSAPAVGG